VAVEGDAAGELERGFVGFRARVGEERASANVSDSRRFARRRTGSFV
jgi:hypothetical protein